MASDTEQIIRRMLDAYNERRFSDFGASYTDDAVISYPQSGEEIVGRDNVQGMVEAFPTPPRFKVNRLSSGGDIVVAEADVDYGEGSPWKGVFIYSMDGEQVGYESAYFSGPFEAPDWRAPYRED